MGLAGNEVANAFRVSVGAFESSFAEWRKHDSYESEHAVSLRISFNELERQASRLDTQAQNYLRELSSRLDIRFGWVLSGAMLLLAVICAVVFHAGRTKDKLAEAARASENLLRENRQFLADLVEYSGALIYVKDFEGRYQLVNRKWEETTGLSRQQVLGKMDVDLFLNSNGNAFRSNDVEVMASKTLLESEELLESPRGSKLFLAIKFPLCDGENRVKGICGMATEITERKRMENELRQVAEQKTALVKEIHHRVKNNLAIMYSLVNLQARKIKNPEVAAALEDTKARLRAMSLLHEMLYSSGRMDRVEMGAYLDRLCGHLAQSLGTMARGITLQSRSQAFSLEINQAVPCGLIVSELVSNAIKHAFPLGQKGGVTVELDNKENGFIDIRVSDRGVGLPDGWSIEKADSLGLTLVKTLVQQLEGTLNIMRNGGTTFEIRFPSMPAT